MGDTWDDKPIRCECYSLDHVVWFHLDDYDGKPELSVSPHLNTWRGFWNRLWHGAKYILGIKTRHGHWDEVHIPYDRAIELNAMIEKYIGMSDAYEARLRIASLGASDADKALARSAAKSALNAGLVSPETAEKFGYSSNHKESK